MRSETEPTAAQPPTPIPWAFRPLVRRLQRLESGTLHVNLPGLSTLRITGTHAGPEAQWTLHRPVRVFREILLRGDIALGETYMDGDWDSDNPADLLELLGRNEHAFGHDSGGRWPVRLLYWLAHRARANTRSGSRRNIAYHYDLGNDFYRTWLDPTMTYSSAVFESASDSLEAAQRRKYRRTLADLQATPGERILEIGCGWGGLAEEASRAGIALDGLTLSTEQHAWASERLAAVPDRAPVRFLLQDYRDTHGEYDHVASIEMFEAVGETHWPRFFRKVSDCLRSGGRAALQIITIDEGFFERYRNTPDFIQRYIFPGGMLPTVSHLREHIARAGLELEQIEGYGAHYARTLAAWDERFQAAAAEIEAQGFGETFQRMWRYYLAYCEAGFRFGRIDLHRVVARKPALA